MIVEGQSFRLTDVDLDEVINILNIIVSFSQVCTLKYMVSLLIKYFSDIMHNMSHYDWDT